ncbi:hypothetical protein [Paraburkholderia sediminicola]|uniref:hypothetical protein n=1 Tax=Paraburkholderia sediminicola TaxID=458836 RepID=UPI0038B8751E
MKFKNTVGQELDVDVGTAHAVHVIAADAPTSILSQLTTVELGELEQWLANQASPSAMGDFDTATDLADCLPDAINLAGWPGWSAAVAKLHADTNDANVAVKDLIARLRAHRSE